MARPVDPTLRDRLLAAAAAEFARHGFAGTTMEAVGKRALVTKGGVYFHFRGKEELFFALLDTWRDGLQQALAGTLALDLTGADRLQAFLREHLEYHFRHPGQASLMRILATELQGRFTTAVREDALVAQRSLRQQLRELLAAGAQDGSVSAVDPALAAVLLAGALEGVLHQWLTAPQDLAPFSDPGRIAEALAMPYRIKGGRPSRRRKGVAQPDDQRFQPPF